MINAYASKGPKGKLEKFEYEEKISPKDVLVKVNCCGICHSDVHLLDGDWGPVFPLVPGHEIVGIVEKVGDEVTLVKEGDKVGVGWHSDSCGECEYCKKGEVTFCSKPVATCWGHFGGFADKLVANENFTIPIPENLDEKETAPLLCGGITVFNPLKRYFKENANAAIIGIGGLGHMAIKFAKALGYNVTAISRSPDKEEMAKKFGADEFSTSPKKAEYDVILNTAHATMDMDEYMTALKPRGVFVQLGATNTPLQINPMELIMGSKIVTGSAVGSPELIKDMLEFASKHNIGAEIQEDKMENCNEAIDITRQNKARFRVVLNN